MASAARSDVPPGTVGVSLREEGVVVEYLDGRTTLYRGVPEAVSGPLTVAPGRETHVLVTDPDGTEGVLTYINDLRTHDEMLEDSGVGRVILEPGEEATLFPGVVARRPGERTEVMVDPETVDGRVFAFVEDGWSEERYEFVADADASGEGGVSTGGNTDTDTDAATDADGESE